MDILDNKYQIFVFLGDFYTRMHDCDRIAFREHFLRGMALMGHEHPSMRARSSSHANIHTISGLARNDLATRYPAIDQV